MKQAVLIMVDTQRQDMLSCYDADAAPTPVLDALAREGMQFTMDTPASRFAARRGPRFLQGFTRIPTG